MTLANSEPQHQLLTKKIQKLIDIGIALSAEKDSDRLLEKILVSAKELTNADGGTLYTVTPERSLHFEIVRTDSIGLSWGGRQTSKAVPFPDLPMYDPDGRPRDQMVVVYSLLHDCTINIADAYHAEGFDFSGTKDFDVKTGYRSQSFLTVPLKNNDNEIIGVLQLINAQDPETKAIIPFSFEAQQLVESMASQAAIAMTNQRLLLELKHMFESLTNVLADAIDAKSPVTGKHCRRVPVIALMLAVALSDTAEGPYKQLKFSQSELYELNIAALLHDCGKVTTPVHVVEKSTKLQTIIDRIDLIDARLEIVRRDREITVLKEKIELLLNHAPEGSYKERFDELDSRIEKAHSFAKEQRTFLHECNLGKESMPLEWQERVSHLASETWRDMDGIERSLINESEKDNLLIFKGTLTDAERKVIQDHVVMTIKMLKEIPYPKYLKEVPEIAGKHHERIDGKGYPCGLTGAQMSVRAKILAIADIFEALTAPDRPYKESMPLSVALKIMDEMAREGHIDQEIYQVFVKEQVYMRYARIYLSSKQIDV